MGRVAYRAAAVFAAAAMASVGVRAGEWKDVRAPDWFWSLPESSSARSSLPESSSKRSSPQSALREPKRGPDWFWSYETPKSHAGVKRALYFSGADLWRQGAFLYGGMLWAPAGFDADGVVVKLTTTSGAYRYRSGLLGGATVTGLMSGVSAMPGLHFTRGGVSATIYAGLDYQLHVLTPDDLGNVARGRHLGMRMAVDLWYEPTPTTVVGAWATLSTIASGYALQATYGWRLFDSIYVGPEALVYGGDTYRQLRIGAHLGGLKLLWVEWQGGVGFAADRDGNRGLYAQLGVSRKW